jgi:hypothetical protein
MNHGKRLERIAKAQAKALIGTLTLLDDEGLGDSDLSALRGSLRSWIEHITPIRKVDERTYCEVCCTNFDDDGFDYRFDYPICHSCVEIKKVVPSE